MPRKGKLQRGLKRKEKRKKWNRKMEQRGPQTAQRSRSWSHTAPATLPNEQAVASFPCVQHILDANRLTWPGVGLHPDCQFAIFIHASQQQEPTRDPIIDTRRKCRRWLRLNPPMISFLKRGRKDAMNIPSSNRASDHQEKGWRVINTPINTPYTVLQAYINSALISF